MSLALSADVAVARRPINLALWVAVAASCLMFRLEASHLPADEVWYWRIWYVSVLQWLLWQELIHYAWRAPPLSVPTPVAIGFLGAFAASVFLFRPEFVNVVLLVAGGGLIAWRWREPAAVRIGVCLLLVLVAHVVGSSLVAPLHSLWARIDARALTLVLTLMGDQPVLQGTLVTVPRLARALSVEFVCSTTWVLTLPLIVFLQVTILRHGRLIARDAKMVAIIFGLTFVLNIVRMVLMTPSQESYVYWHFGTGADLFSLATAILVFVALRSAEPETQGGRDAVAA